jgi:exopolyphosphatase/guanosine-5'-triphosphate,3'-diphosphate pyrophosphatase
MIAAIARYHRRSLPKKRHEAWQLIEGRAARQTVASMALLLRLAAALDRRPQAVIEHLVVQAPRGGLAEGGVLPIQLRAITQGAAEGSIDLSLERWSLQGCSDAVQEACGLELSVTASEQPQS